MVLLVIALISKIPPEVLREIHQFLPLKAPRMKKLNKGAWSKFLSRVFGLDISKCSECGGEMRVVASVVRVDVIKKILTHLGLSPQPPPVAPACSRQLFLV